MLKAITGERLMLFCISVEAFSSRNTKLLIVPGSHTHGGQDKEVKVGAQKRKYLETRFLSGWVLAQRK